jgi:hypothetical protein
MTENIEVTPAKVEEVKSPIVEAPKPVVEAPKPASSKSEVPAPGTPEFAAWAWEHRNG